MLNCECITEPESSESEVKTQTTEPYATYSPQEYQLTVDFGVAVVGKVVTKPFTIKNEMPRKVNYFIKRNPITNPIYQMFDFDHYEDQVEPKKLLECTITYSPVIPHEYSADVFHITDSYNNSYRVHVKGECKGPSIGCSVNIINFYKYSKNEKCNRTFELENKSTVGAKYHFDINGGSQAAFQIDKVYGVLGPNKHTYIQVSFNPHEPRVYCMDLVCLILYHEPIIVKLVGVYSLSNANCLGGQKMLHYPFAVEDTAGYGGYLLDSLKIRKTIPPVSLSDNFLDFGRFLSEDCIKRSCSALSLVTSLTNHTKRDVEVIWEKDEDNMFQISPERVVIPAEKSVLYECQFNPNFKDQVYGKTLTAEVMWSRARENVEQDEIVVPLTISLRLIGHSFPVNECWIPQAEIFPSRIVLPACSPNCPTSATFVIKAKGYLPLLFKLIPPRNSNFVMKPMAGMVRDFQIIVVHLQPDPVNNYAYVEHWNIELNGQKERLLPLYIKCQAEWPFVVVGEINEVKFESTLPGCQAVVKTPFTNPGPFPVEYNFNLTERPYLKVDKPKGIQQSNEMTFLTWYLDVSPKLEKKFSIQCEVYAVQKMTLTTGKPIDVNVNIYAECNYAELCATPSDYDFGELRWGSKDNHTAFILFNFGLSVINFELVCEGMPKKSKIELNPKTGTVRPKEKCAVIVKFVPKDTGEHFVKLYYSVRLNESSTELADPEWKHETFKFKFSCIYPVLQDIPRTSSVQFHRAFPNPTDRKIIELVSNFTNAGCEKYHSLFESQMIMLHLSVSEIRYYNCGYLFNKLDLWRFLNIETLNQTLLQMKNKDVKSIEVMLPESEVNPNEEFTIVLDLKNITQFPTEFTLKKQQICTCPLQEDFTSISVRQFRYNCPHRNMLNIKINDPVVKGHSSTDLIVQIKYLIPGMTDLLYTVKLSENRSIHFHIHIRGLDPLERLLSVYSVQDVIELNDVFIGEKNPVLQTFWLYNNTNQTAPFVLDESLIRDLNSERGIQVLLCLNVQGFIQPFSAVPIIFKFAPNLPVLHKLALPICVGNRYIEFELQCSGTASYNRKESLIAEKMPLIPLKLTGQPVQLSVNCIESQLSVWSTAYHMIFMTNRSERIYNYQWISSYLTEIVQIETHKTKGKIQPKSVEVVVIKITTFDQPCRLPLNLSCEIFDYTQLILHKQTRAVYDLRQKQVEEEFTITENGEEVHEENTVVIAPTPKPQYLTIGFEINILSTEDRDLSQSVGEQIAQSPKSAITLNKDRVLKTLNLKTDVEVQTGKAETDFNSFDIYEDLRQEIDLESIELFRLTMECILADLVFSKLFAQIVKSLDKYPDTYYVQFKMDTEDTFEDTQKENIAIAGKRKELIKAELNAPKLEAITEIFSKLLIDSFANVFNAGVECPVEHSFAHRHRGKCKDVKICFFNENYDKNDVHDKFICKNK